MTLIALSAGHYKYTPGKRIPAYLDPDETREWELNRRIVDKIQTMLLRYENVNYLRTDDPTGETAISIQDRAKMSDKANADFYLSIHHNAGINGGNGGGTVVYYYPTTRNRNEANELYKEIYNRTGLKGNRSQPVKSTTSLYEVTAPAADAILVECAFMDSAVDVKYILTEEWSTHVAAGCVAFLANWFNLKLKVEELDEPPKEDVAETYIVKAGDTLAKIAKSYRVEVNDIVAMNGIKNPNIISVGQKLYIPKSEAQYMKYAVTANVLNIRKSATVLSKKVGALTSGTKVEISDISGRWGELADGRGWICLDYAIRVN